MKEMRIAGYAFLLLATTAMAWDANLLLAGYGSKGFSGIMQIWKMIDETSLKALEVGVIGNIGYSFWYYFMAPFLSLPAAALFGVIGLLMLRTQSHEIKLRAPSPLEIEMMRQGLNPRRMRRR